MNIGLIGAENSHTINFCKAINSEKRYPGYTITHVYGADSPAACAKLIENYGLAECASEEEIIGLCDALVVTYRRGSQHYPAVMKTLAAGKPVFNDKPFTTDVGQAKEIADYAAEHNILLCGGSTVKSLPGLDAFAEKIKPGAAVTVSYRADPDSEYDGFWFYGIHSVEACVKLLGFDYKSVSACRSGGSVIASINYGDVKCVVVTTTDAEGPYVSVMNGDASETIKIPDTDEPTAPNEFIEMLKTGKPPLDYSFYVGATKLAAEIIEAAGI